MNRTVALMVGVAIVVMVAVLVGVEFMPPAPGGWR